MSIAITSARLWQTMLVTTVLVAASVWHPLAATANTTIWSSVAVPGGQVSVSMPGTPTHSDKSVDTSALGPLEYHVYQVRARSGPEAGVYTFTYTRLKDGRSDDVLPTHAWLEHMANQQTDAWKRKAGASLQSSKDIKVKGYSGRDLVLKLPDGIMKIRIIVAGSQAITLGSIQQRAKLNKHADQFINSLKINRAD